MSDFPQALPHRTPLDMPWTGDPRHASTAGNVGVPDGNDRAVYCRVYGRGVITKIRIYVGTSGGNIDVGVYQNTGVGFSADPGARLGSSGTVACPAAGKADVNLTAATQHEHGDWYALLSSLAATAKFYAFVGGTAIWCSGLFRKQNVAAATLPSSAVSLADDTRCFVMVGVP